MTNTTSNPQSPLVGYRKQDMGYIERNYGVKYA